MAIARSTYTQGSLPYSDKDWYHGELTRYKAEQALAASGGDCFFIRHSLGKLILSLIHHGELHHTNIKYGPGWYELENGTAQYSFPDLEEMVDYYSCNSVSPNDDMTLGTACKKTREKIQDQPISPHYDVISDSIYSTGKPMDIAKYIWFYGNITKEQAVVELGLGNSNKFLIRNTSDTLMLSYTISGWKYHTVIINSTNGYRLDGKSTIFKSVSDLLTHYQQYPIHENNWQVLGRACDRRSSEYLKAIERRNKADPNIIFEKKNDRLSLDWTRKSDLPITISSPQVVKVNYSVFVGGGFRQKSTPCIFQYSILNNTWRSLPECPAHDQGLASWDGELISIGGAGPLYEATNTVYTFRNGDWSEILPPMLTARYFLTALSHNNQFIIAAGGKTGKTRDGQSFLADNVEIYIGDGLTWFASAKLPTPMTVLSTCTANDTCYLLGGIGTENASQTVLYAPLTSLIDVAALANGSLMHEINEKWNILRTSHPLSFASAVELDEKLVAMGGSHDEILRCGTRFISTYDFASDTWVECKGAQLPVPLYRPGVVKLAHNKVMVIGGQPKMQEFSKKVYIGSWKLKKNNYVTSTLC